MSNSGQSSRAPAANLDPRVPLLKLSMVRERMDSLQQFLSNSVNSNALMSKDEMDMVSAEISTAIQQIIVNGTALLSCSQSVDKHSDLKTQTKITNQSENKKSSLEVEDKDDLDLELDSDIVEMDAVELLAEHVHFCEICGKGFKRDANLRMHMRAHGNQFKTPEALSRPDKGNEFLATGRKRRFSCPYEGCNRNKKHKKFRPLKSVVCVRNHFKRSHCPKMYSCNRCKKRSFSVVADLRSHLKHCGESRWRCSCGTTFSRKDKLFGHMTLFEGHMPAVVGEDEDKDKGKSGAVAVEEDEEEEGGVVKGEKLIGNCMDNDLFEGLLEGFGSFDEYNLQDVFFESPSNSSNNNNNWGHDDFYGFSQS
ncbi:protein SENSITIVE TO PROTON RHIZOTOXICITY 1 [Ricinus communis]|uniref:TRANSPARENT TESTA 1 protein, putative n=1 Tax=Ricinus communis TaxID=3988 RepID=B9T3M0_RICCO|nr:protein SENSITIVE TO PROTON RHIZOTOXICITY 1 [Ricinus communis]EEF29546.1 TRANSPARENT TESTA 1 protein, putative [Ricinus communis]|eukprot:XP_002532839.1 protein SENSITIVE TO PROTON RHIZOTOXICITY 1 [Ricinus communis]